MDIGFLNAGFKILWANDFDPVACETYRNNHSTPIVCGDIDTFIPELSKFKGADVVFGGPPCQGFSVAGKMDPTDPRSKLIWSFLSAVEKIQPRLFVMENVRALGLLDKWSEVRASFVQKAERLGYGCTYTILNASMFGVPQSRERVFFVGIKGRTGLELPQLFDGYSRKAPTVRSVITRLGLAGNPKNARICKAKITLAEKPVMRKSPYAGMMFNGLGRPLRLDGICSTLPASMGGNKTPIIDEGELYESLSSWIEEYHKYIMDGGETKFGLAPKRLRRLTVDEAILLQTFPKDYNFAGGNSAIYRQIGNSVPPKFAECIAAAIHDYLQNNKTNPKTKTGQQMFMLDGVAERLGLTG